MPFRHESRHAPLFDHLTTNSAPGLKLAGVTVGCGSELAIFKQIVANAASGSIDDIATQTDVRMADGAFAEWAVPQAAAAASLFSNLTGDISGKAESSVHSYLQPSVLIQGGKE